MTRVEAFIESESSVLEDLALASDAEVAGWLEFHFLLWTHFVVDEVWS